MIVPPETLIARVALMQSSFAVSVSTPSSTVTDLSHERSSVPAPVAVSSIVPPEILMLPAILK